MSPDQKSLLTAVFEALGPERVTRGLKASVHSWNDCFLALAISGEPDALTRELETRWRKERIVSSRLGVRVQVINAVVRAWDQHEGAFQALAAEWLELNGAAVSTKSVESWKVLGRAKTAVLLSAMVGLRPNGGTYGSPHDSAVAAL